MKDPLSWRMPRAPADAPSEEALDTGFGADARLLRSRFLPLLQHGFTKYSSPSLLDSSSSSSGSSGSRRGSSSRTSRSRSRSTSKSSRSCSNSSNSSRRRRRRRRGSGGHSNCQLQAWTTYSLQHKNTTNARDLPSRFLPHRQVPKRMEEIPAI